jgi:hypothetical protein
LQKTFEAIRNSGTSATEALAAVQSIERNPLIDPARATELVAPARPSGAAHTLTGCRKDRRDGKYGVREGS